MTDWQKQAEAFNAFIRPQTFPIGIKMVESEDGFPDKTRRPFRDLGFRTTICVAIAMTRKYGWTVGITEADNMCPLVSRLYGWSGTDTGAETNLFNFLKSMNYGANEAAISVMLESTRAFMLDKGHYAGIVFSPLELGRLDPDVVMVFCNTAQLMRLVHAATRERGASIDATFSGRFGTCNEGILQSLKLRQPKVVLPGNGDRVWGMVQDDEMIFTLPGSMIDQITEGLAATHKAGVRYPIPIDVRHAPNFPA